MMTPRLEALAAWLRTAASSDTAASVADTAASVADTAASAADTQTRVYVDTGAILERDHAESAGLGFTGKNTMLIAPRRGSWFFLGEILTTVPLPPDIPAAMPSCGRCQRCLEACPTNAFPQPYVLDARRCISYLTIELKGEIPHDLRPLMGNWIYGCDVCQLVCPFNRFAPASGEAAFWAQGWESAAPPLLDLLQLDEAGFQERYAHSPIKRIKRPRLLRNVCVAAGNWGDAAAVPHLTALLSDDSPLVRGHAAWALAQIKKADRSTRPVSFPKS
jgi:epoxyqueuosine reductase